jgi:prepilin-type N-terminal cleavage/methylation domain-containing protein
MLKYPSSSGIRAGQGFTLIELLTVIVVVGILATMVSGIAMDMRSRADRVKCVQNLKNLYTGAASYVAQQGSWPQIDPTAGGSDRTVYAKSWVAALQPLGLTEINWLCPTVQRVLNNPDMTKDENYRIDYIATPFDDKAMTPFLWPHQPWFVEHASVHGTGGNLLIMSSGQVMTLEEALRYN